MSCSFLVIIRSHFQKHSFLFTYFILHIFYFCTFMFYYYFIYFIYYYSILSYFYKLVVTVVLTKVYPASIYFCKVNNGNTRKRSEICSKLIIKTPVQVASWRVTCKLMNKKIGIVYNIILIFETLFSNCHGKRRLETFSTANNQVPSLLNKKSIKVSKNNKYRAVVATQRYIDMPVINFSKFFT